MSIWYLVGILPTFSGAKTRHNVWNNVLEMTNVSNVDVFSKYKLSMSMERIALGKDTTRWISALKSANRLRATSSRFVIQKPALN